MTGPQLTPHPGWRAFPQETFAAYRASSGYSSEGKLVAALEKWGPNKFEVGHFNCSYCFYCSVVLLFPCMPAQPLRHVQHALALCHRSCTGGPGLACSSRSHRNSATMQVPVPAFRELLWEQLLAPFFCFQVRSRKRRSLCLLGGCLFMRNASGVH